MGCDIHATYEVRRDGVWTCHDWSAPYKLGEYEDGSTRWDYERMWQDPLELDRNYYIFAVLGDVRNSWCIKPIDSYRGLPEDATAEAKELAERWDADGHSHSWVTLAELLAYDWDQGSEHGDWFDERFRTKTIPALQQLGAPDDVRIVFFFDN